MQPGIKAFHFLNEIDDALNTHKKDLISSRRMRPPLEEKNQVDFVGFHQHGTPNLRGDRGISQDRDGHRQMRRIPTFGFLLRLTDQSCDSKKYRLA